MATATPQSEQQQQPQPQPQPQGNAKRGLRKPVFTKVDQLKPGTGGHTLTAKVLSSNTVLQKGRSATQHLRHTRIAECLVGDDTGTIIFTARNDQGCPFMIYFTHPTSVSDAKTFSFSPLPCAENDLHSTVRTYQQVILTPISLCHSSYFMSYCWVPQIYRCPFEFLYGSKNSRNSFYEKGFFFWKYSTDWSVLKNEKKNSEKVCVLAFISSEFRLLYHKLLKCLFLYSCQWKTVKNTSRQVQNSDYTTNY